MAHEVGGDSAEVKGQDIPVVVGIGSPAGEALVSGGAGRVVAAGVGVCLYGQLPLTVLVQGVLPLRAEREVRAGPPCAPYHTVSLSSEGRGGAEGRQAAVDAAWEGGKEEQ